MFIGKIFERDIRSFIRDALKSAKEKVLFSSHVK